jgi:hypothetical protein
MNWKFDGIGRDLIEVLRRDADNSLASPICSTTTRIFLGWVKEVRTTKSCVELRGNM